MAVKGIPADKGKVLGYLPEDMPPVGAMLSLGFQQVLTMFPATVLVAILTKFDIGVTLFTSGLGTIIALLVSRRRIPLYYGSSFSYIAVIITVMATYAGGCFNDPLTSYCREGVRIAQVGIIGTAVIEILIGLLIIRDRQGCAGQGPAAHHHRHRRDRHRHRACRHRAERGGRRWQSARPQISSGAAGPLRPLPCSQPSSSRSTCRAAACSACCPSCWARSSATSSRFPSA